MRAQTKLPMFFIISAERSSEFSLVNELNTAALESHLRAFGASFKRVQGCYKGVTEESFLVVGSEKLAAHLRDTFNQECYLVVDENRRAFLQYPTGPGVAVGTWMEHHGARAGLEAYTVDPSTGRTYVCK